jgi:hypothetical protein
MRVYWFVTQQRISFCCWERNFGNIFTSRCIAMVMRHSIIADLMYLAIGIVRLPACITIIFDKFVLRQTAATSSASAQFWVVRYWCINISEAVQSFLLSSVGVSRYALLIISAKGWRNCEKVKQKDRIRLYYMAIGIKNCSPKSFGWLLNVVVTSQLLSLHSVDWSIVVWLCMMSHEDGRGVVRGYCRLGPVVFTYRGWGNARKATVKLFAFLTETWTRYS